MLKACILFTRIFLGLLLAASPPLCAKEIWSNNSLSLLYGTTYKVPMSTNQLDEKRYVITLDHVSANSWGDVFSFLDITRSIDGNQPNNLYGEFNANISLTKLINLPKTHSLIANYNIATAIEYGASATGFTQLNYLYGLGLNIAIPGVKVLRISVYRRDNQRSTNSWQVTPVWIIPFSIANADFSFDGWLDMVSSTASRPVDIHSQIQLRFDAGKHLFNKEKTFYLGTEFKYWRNKFGIRGVEERVWQAMARLFF